MWFLVLNASEDNKNQVDFQEVLEKVEAWKMFVKIFLKKWNFKTSIWNMDDGSKNFRAMSIRRLQIS